MHAHKFPGHRCMTAYPAITYAAKGRMTLAEGQRVHDATVAQCEDACRRYDEAKAAEGTGPQSLVRYQERLAESGRLNRHDKAAIRRAVALGKAVPDALARAAGVQ